MKQNIIKFAVYLATALPLGGVGGGLLTSCQDKDIEREAMKLSAPDASQITGQLSGDDYTWTWPSQGTEMRVITYRNGTLSSTETVSGNSFTHKNIPTNVPFEYVFKASDGNNISTGVIKAYTREGATSITGVQMSQLDKTGGYDALVEWNKAADASSILLTATNGLRTINETLSGSATNYTISDVETGDTWEVKLVAQNEKGTSLSTTSSLRIGKTAIGFLSIYGTPEELVENGDDDEASAWLWLHETYPTAQFVCFDDARILRPRKNRVRIGEPSWNQSVPGERAPCNNEALFCKKDDGYHRQNQRNGCKTKGNREGECN